MRKMCIYGGGECTSVTCTPLHIHCTGPHAIFYTAKCARAKNMRDMTQHRASTTCAEPSLNQQKLGEGFEVSARQSPLEVKQ